MAGETTVVEDPWGALRELTSARVAIGRTGSSVPTAGHLAFQQARAHARDAVHHLFDAPAVAAALTARGLSVRSLRSAARDRSEYLRRPDLGRRLDGASHALLADAGCSGSDAVFLLADGLAPVAVERHAPPLLDILIPKLRADGWSIGPAVVVEQGRVAIGDEVGELLSARLVAVLIGERPGLTAPDSLGAYLTFLPRIGRVDAERNCVSNIRPDGLSYAAAAHRIGWLLRAARQRQLTGIGLREEAPPVESPSWSLDEGATRRGREAT
ncbi:MAG: ethanolamine ammonia-lyase subunit EutC [Gemmatimonadaceae bacterium]